MATIRKRNGKWHAQVRRSGCPSQTRTFSRKEDAQRWARHIETEADRAGLPMDRASLKRLTVADVLTRYREAVLPKKRATTRKVEGDILTCLLRYPFADVSLVHVSPAHFTDFRDERLRTVKPATVHRELGLIQHAFEIARREWGLPLSQNPLATVKTPPLGNRRDRRLEGDEWERLMAACQRCRNKRIEPLIRLAVETGMRRSELVSIRQHDLELERRTLHIPHTKNGHARTIPLSSAAVDVLASLEPAEDGRLFPMTPNAVRLAWDKLTRRAGIDDLHFHDLRHEAISRLFEKGLSIPEVALISGHRDYRMLYRYTHLKATDIAAKL